MHPLAFAAPVCRCAPSIARPALSPRRRGRAPPAPSAPAPCPRRGALGLRACAPRAGRGGRGAEYHANVGSVIDGLREDYPLLPCAEPSLGLYAANVTLRLRAGLVCEGLSAYRGVLWLMRAQLRVCFGARVAVGVHGLFHDAGAGQVFVRWRLTATPRLLGGGGGGAPATGAGAPFVYDGLSVYTLNDSGLIQDHLLESVVRLRRPLRPLFESVLAGTSSTAAAPIRAGAGAGAGARAPTWCAVRRGEFVPLPTELQADAAPAENVTGKERERAAALEAEEAPRGMGVIAALAATLGGSPVCQP